jgi:hypothetical protein
MSRCLDAAQARIATLEDCLAQFVPFAACHDVEIVGVFREQDVSSAKQKIADFKRDTLHLDMTPFRQAAALMRKRWTDGA